MRPANNATIFGSVPVELKLLAACAIRPPHTDSWLRTVHTLSQGVSNWPEFARLVRRHQLPVLAYDALKRLPADAVPAATLQQLEQVHRASRLQTLAQIAECKRMAAAFGASNIPSVQLKGAPLSQRLYGDAYLRCSGDVDVLVPMTHVGDAAKTLCQLGHTPIDAPPDITLLSGRLRQLTYHHCAFMNKATSVHTELHWRLHGWSVSFAAAEIDQRIPDATTDLAALQPAVEMVDLLVHGTNHYWYLLKWLADIQQALITLPTETWESIADKAVELHATHSLQMALQLTAALYSGIGPEANFSQSRTRIAHQTARYAMQRLNAKRIAVTGLRSAIDRSAYRLASATPYGRLSAALRCVC